jgi:hypothetical protein
VYGERADFGLQSERLFAQVNNVQLIESQVLQGSVHRFGGSRSGRAFELEAAALVTADDQQVQLCATLGTPEKKLGVSCTEQAYELSSNEHYLAIGK